MPTAPVESSLRSFFRALGGIPSGAGLVTAPGERPFWHGTVEIVTASPAPVGGWEEPAPAFADGCQAALLLAGPERRPMLLLWASAVAMTIDQRRIAHREETWLCCSAIDVEYVAGLPGVPEVRVVASLLAPDIRRDALAQLRERRAEMEHEVVAELALESWPLLVDGTLLGHTARAGVVAGVVKSHATRYLGDETGLERLEVGHMGPLLRLPPRTVTEPERWSAFLRLHPPNGDNWTHGLIRLEAWDREVLAPAGAAAFAHRQSPCRDDARWSVHLIGVRRCEELMKARRPWVFGN